jgi:hypothetical protein
MGERWRLSLATPHFGSLALARWLQQFFSFSPALDELFVLHNTNYLLPRTLFTTLFTKSVLFFSSPSFFTDPFFQH